MAKRKYFRYVIDGETANYSELQKMKLIDQPIWGDVFYNLYQRSDGKLFAQSTYLGNTTGQEGYWEEVK